MAGVQALELHGVSREFRRGFWLRPHAALREVDLGLEAGARLGLVGPNGSGKSTLLRLIAGVDRPSAGEVRVLGQPARGSVQTRVGFLPEDSPFPPELTARAALDLLGSVHGLGRSEVRARGARLLDEVGLAADSNRRLGRYSRGMLRRFGLAQAWLHEPELLLLDEPTAGLDAEGFEALDVLLERAHERGATVVLASHLIGDLQVRCDELAVLVGGRLAERGSSAELLARPGAWRLELSGLERAQLAELEAWVAREGGRVVEVAPSGRTLVELYRGALDAAR